MRIGLSCTTIEPGISQGKIDGIGTYTKNLLEIYTQQGKKVLPISFPHNISQSALPNGKIFPQSYTASMITSFLRSMPISWKNEIDIFHATDHMIPKLKDIPIVATVHDALMFKYPKWFYNTRFASLKKWARKKSLAWADHVITGAKAMIPELVDYCGIQPEKISVVNDGISPWWLEKISSSEKNAILQKIGITQKFVLFTGTLHPKKNLPRLIRAFLQLPQELLDEYQLVIVGRSGWDTEESLQAIQKLRADNKGLWLDYVSIEELRVLFQSATAYLHPSLHEGFGLTLLQAFASGTPVLTSNITAMPETAGGAAYLVDPYDVDNIYEGIKTILLDKTLQQQCITKGYQRVQDFSWSRCAEETLAVYQRLI